MKVSYQPRRQKGPASTWTKVQSIERLLWLADRPAPWTYSSFEASKLVYWRPVKRVVPSRSQIQLYALLAASRIWQSKLYRHLAGFLYCSNFLKFSWSYLSGRPNKTWNIDSKLSTFQQDGYKVGCHFAVISGNCEWLLSSSVQQRDPLREDGREIDALQVSIPLLI